MGLNAAYTGEGELATVMDDIHDNVGDITGEGNVLGDTQAGLLGLWAAFVGAVYAAQHLGTNTRDRIADDVGPQTASIIMNIASQISVLHQEIITSSTITAAEIAATADPENDFTALGPVH